MKNDPSFVPDGHHRDSHSQQVTKILQHCWGNI